MKSKVTWELHCWSKQLLRSGPFWMGLPLISMICELTRDPDARERHVDKRRKAFTCQSSITVRLFMTVSLARGQALLLIEPIEFRVAQADTLALQH